MLSFDKIQKIEDTSFKLTSFLFCESFVEASHIKHFKFLFNVSCLPEMLRVCHQDSLTNLNNFVLYYYQKYILF